MTIVALIDDAGSWPAIHASNGSMGVLYIVMPLNDEGAAWLDHEGIDHPPPSPQNRYPTPREILNVLDALPDYEYELTCNRAEGDWYASVFSALNRSEGPWTAIVVPEYKADDLPHSFYFSKGWPEIIFLVTERLTRLCGPLVVADDSCAIPLLVQPGMPLETILSQYDAQESASKPEP